MFPHYYFKFAHMAALLGVIALTVPVTAHCMVAGRADFVIGKVEAITADGARRPLIKGSEINTSETISTDVAARAQIRFNDGGFISLQPNSLFRVDEFNYQNKTDGREKSFFSLLKGGLRAITGAIGRVNRDTYRVTTPVATIGIRGTGYNAMLNDGLYVNVGEGAISLTNNAGLLLVSAGGAAFVVNINTPPEPTMEQPQTPPAELEEVIEETFYIDEIPYVIAENLGPTGIPSILPHLVSGPGYTLAYAYMDCATKLCAPGGSGKLANVTATFSDTSQLLAYNLASLVSATEAGTLVTPALENSSATDGIIGWGRWVGNTVSVGTVPSLASGVFHYVIGMPTAVMPTTGTATYNLIGYTTPTATDGTTGWNVSGSLTASFSAATASTVRVNLTVANPIYTYGLSGTATAIGSAFNTTIIGSGTTCTSCVTTINGLFAGDNAVRAGLTYNIADINRSVQGAAAFSQ